jgi:hypothetical protein
MGPLDGFALKGHKKKAQGIALCFLLWGVIKP